ncbi:hypothetical protein BGX38DRAFT_92626 [Terfezia claveryi]|nr:hypothetical protein BGX38DRAFT_92626 [Terfezia claveryi]
MKSRTDVIHSMYPSTTTPSAQPSSQQAITAQVATNALTLFGTRNKGRSLASGVHSSEHITPRAYTCLSLLPPPLRYPRSRYPTFCDQRKRNSCYSKNTYGTIGVSKSCLSLLSKHSQGQIQAVMDRSGNEGMLVFHEPELKVLNSHGNIYTTALLPFLPKGVAGESVKWLVGLLKHAVNKVVKRERRGSNGSADSTGQSPQDAGGSDLRGGIIQLPPPLKA